MRSCPHYDGGCKVTPESAFDEMCARRYAKALVDDPHDHTYYGLCLQCPDGQRLFDKLGKVLNLDTARSKHRMSKQPRKRKKIKGETPYSRFYTGSEKETISLTSRKRSKRRKREDIFMDKD